MIDVVIPTLNEAKALPGTLKALLAAGFRLEEIIVVDGGSTDGTRGIAEASGVKCVEAGKGRASQLQAGVENGTADTILFLHADTVVRPGARDAILAARENGSRWGAFERHFSPNSPVLAFGSLLAGLRMKLWGISYGDQAQWVCRDLLRAIGGVPPVPGMEDLELALRLRDLAPRAICKPAVTSSARRFSGGAWKRQRADLRLVRDYIAARGEGQTFR